MNGIERVIQRPRSALTVDNGFRPANPNFIHAHSTELPITSTIAYYFLFSTTDDKTLDDQTLHYHIPGIIQFLNSGPPSSTLVNFRVNWLVSSKWVFKYLGIDTHCFNLSWALVGFFLKNGTCRKRSAVCRFGGYEIIYHSFGFSLIERNELIVPLIARTHPIPFYKRDNFLRSPINSICTPFSTIHKPQLPLQSLRHLHVRPPPLL